MHSLARQTDRQRDCVIHASALANPNPRRKKKQQKSPISFVHRGFVGGRPRMPVDAM
jgi:hypothetical protein